jgi:hypothetical protein
LNNLKQPVPSQIQLLTRLTPSGCGQLEDRDCYQWHSLEASNSNIQENSLYVKMKINHGENV